MERDKNRELEIKIDAMRKYYSKKSEQNAEFKV